MIHGRSKHRKASAEAGSDHGTAREGGIRVHEVDIDDVGQTLQEHNLQTSSERNTRDDLRPWADMRRRRPREPEAPDGQKAAADHHGNQSIFRVHLPFLFEFGRHCRQGHVSYIARACENTDSDSEERKSADAKIIATVLPEADRVGLEKEVDDAVDKTDVKCNEKENGFQR